MSSTYRKVPINFLKKVLEESLDRMKGSLSERLDRDPVFFPHLYEDNKDIEFAAFIAAQFAYGNANQIIDFLRKLYLRIDGEICRFIKKGKFDKLDGLYYRFQKTEDIKDLFSVLKAILDNYGSLGELFSSLYKGDLRRAIFSLHRELGIFSSKLFFFFPLESPSNPLKRWNLFLRWMVRKDEVDFGIWQFILPKDLLIPLDTHIFKISRCLGLTRRKTKDAKTVLEVTEKMKLICPEDPLRYDFFLCHFVGIDKRCSGFPEDSCKGRCVFYG